MKIQKNSRQMPKNPEVTANKIYSDILYGYFQEISIREDDIRYISKEQSNSTTLSNTLQISRQTISKKLNQLIELGLILPSKNPNFKYELPIIPSHEAFLIPQETLRKMVNTLAPKTISIYIYLANLWYANKENLCHFTISALKAYVGLSLKTKSNNTIITDILEILAKLNLIKYTIITKKVNSKYRTYYELQEIKQII